MATASVFTVDQAVVEKALSVVHTSPAVCSRRAGRLMAVMSFFKSPFTWRCTRCNEKFYDNWCRHRHQTIKTVAFSPKNIFMNAKTFTAYATRQRNAGPEVLKDFELLCTHLRKTMG